MYTPKTTSIGFLIFGIIFFVFGGSFLLSTGVSVSNFAIVQGEILNYSTTPEIRYEYNGKEYESRSKSSMSCNNQPCNSVGDQVTLFIDEENPFEIVTLGEILFVLIFPGIGLCIIIGWIIAYNKSNVRKQRILALQGTGAYVEASMVDIEEVRSKNKNGTSHVIGYIYLCKDVRTGEIYRSDRIKDPVFEVGSKVRVIKDNELYWVDLNTVTQSEMGSTVATEYQNQKLQIEEKILRSEVKMTLSYSQSIPLLLGLGIPMLVAGIMLPFFGLIFFGGLLTVLGLWSIPGFIQERKEQKIRSKNISMITTVNGVEKVGNWKMVTLGYLPPEEKNNTQIDITTINDGGGVKKFHFAGYPFRFYIDINGMSRVTEKFSKPFPKKYVPGAKVRVYFDDMMHNGAFVTDLESIDELN